MKSSLRWLALGLALISAPISALINGQFDAADRYAAVVVIWSDATRRCSATKIAPDTLLTAAHCVVDVKTGALAPAFQAAGTLHVGTTPEATPATALSVTVRATQLPPAFADGFQRLYAYQQSLIADYRARYSGDALAQRIRRVQAEARITDRFPDAALVQLATPTPMIPMQPLSLAPLPAGAAVILVGYGCERVRDWQRPDRHSHPARRHWGQSEVIRVDAVNFYTFGSERRAGSATLCPGDSGGPVLLNNQVVGVHGTVWGLSGRDTARSNMSVNLHALADWLSSFQPPAIPAP